MRMVYFSVGARSSGPVGRGARSPCIPLGAGTRDLFEALPIPVELRELRLMVEPFSGFEEAVRGLPWGAADSCRTLGLFAVEVARVTLACRCGLDGTRDRDAVWSSSQWRPEAPMRARLRVATSVATLALVFIADSAPEAIHRTRARRTSGSRRPTCRPCQNTPANDRHRLTTMGCLPRPREHST
jgi:hypothetical protein